MRPPAALLAVGALVSVLLAGCSKPQSGVAQPADSTPDGSGGPSGAPTRTSSSSASSPLAGVDPCELLSDSERAQLKLEVGEPKTIARSKTCYWDSSDVWAVGVGLKADLAFKDADLRGATPTRVSIGRHEAYEVRNAGGGEACEIFIITGESSFAQVTANTLSGGNTPLACEISTAVAKIIDPKLP